MELREITYLAIVLRIASAIIIGGLLGLERGMKKRPAGMRTYMLVCVGACIIMLTNQYVFQLFNTGDPVRMGAQVVNGIGFFGCRYDYRHPSQSNQGSDDRCRSVDLRRRRTCIGHRLL